jgi:hypothetical protein
MSDPNRKPKRSWLNPLAWIEQIYAFFIALVTGILQLFGLMPPPNTEGFENIQPADVEAAAAGAVEKQTAIDVSMSLLGRPEIVYAYALATEEQRAAMDLARLSPLEQDWLLGLSDADLVLLAASGLAACSRSLRDRTLVTNVRRLRDRSDSISGSDNEDLPDEDDREERNRAYVSARFRKLMSMPAGTDPGYKSVPYPLH